MYKNRQIISKIEIKTHPRTEGLKLKTQVSLHGNTSHSQTNETFPIILQPPKTILTLIFLLCTHSYTVTIDAHGNQSFPQFPLLGDGLACLVYRKWKARHDGNEVLSPTGAGGRVPGRKQCCGGMYTAGS